MDGSRSNPERGRSDWLQRVARSRLPVLIQGESGVGKERLAREIHERSGRPGRWVAVNCAALPENLLEAELFGVVRGAYTGADRSRRGLLREAERGTLLLDEVGDLPTSVQGKLLRCLQEGTVRPVGGSESVAHDARIVAATHRDLARGAAEGWFRPDLYYRLSVLRCSVAPLRRRKGELKAIVASLAQRLSHETACAAPVLTPCAWRALTMHEWPGNVRELHSVLARAMIRADGAVITGEIIRRSVESHEGVTRLREPDGTLLESRMIEGALRESNDNVSLAARRIGWSRQKLYRRIEALRIPRSDQDSPESTTSSESSTFQ